MTLTLAGADIRGYYAALGIAIPGWSTTNAPVRCFLSAESHQREDRTPSASVDLISGAFLCHGCGAHGGAYDAALARGHTPRSAIDLMIAHGLTERRSGLRTARELLAPSPPRPRPRVAPRPQLRTTPTEVARWQLALENRPNLALRLAHDRGWTLSVMRWLGLGWDRSRVTIPIRDDGHGLIGVLRYQPHETSRPKMLAVPGTRLGLIPHPIAETAARIVLVEGPPDMIAARSHGIPAIAVPGDHAWHPSWAPLLSGRQVVIVMDSDAPGRAAAARIQRSLSGHTEATVVDLAPDRDDGFDLTDWLATRPSATVHELMGEG